MLFPAAHENKYCRGSYGEQCKYECMADTPDKRISTAFAKRTQPAQETGAQPLAKAGILALAQS